MTDTFDLADYPFMCACGEEYKKIEYAAQCRKCRVYCVFEYCTHVTDTRTGEVVWGREPSQEEYEEARERAEAKWEEEKAAFEYEMQMRRQEEAKFEAEQEQRRRDEEEDLLWDIQDSMEQQ